jgi:hypothetical protein
MTVSSLLKSCAIAVASVHAWSPFVNRSTFQHIPASAASNPLVTRKGFRIRDPQFLK